MSVPPQPDLVVELRIVESALQAPLGSARELIFRERFSTRQRRQWKKLHTQYQALSADNRQLILKLLRQIIATLDVTGSGYWHLVEIIAIVLLFVLDRSSASTETHETEGGA